MRHPFDNTVWVLGGGRTAPNPSAQVDVYNPTTNTFTTAPSMLAARRNFPADMNLAGEEMWVSGGYDAGRDSRPRATSSSPASCPST